jgi:phage repressor protein C with HTH and peptisase S24 domain
MARAAAKGGRMLTHREIWGAIDAIAARNGLSASGLAKKAGLDPTTFNKSKRITPDGRHRWPSTESVAKVLEATGTDLDAFMSVVFDLRGMRPSRSIPLIGLDEAGDPSLFDQHGTPVGRGWNEVSFPGGGDERVYALEVTDGSAAPVFREGDILVAAPKAPVRRGDRVVVHCRSGEVIIAELKRRTARTLELKGFDRVEDPRVLDAGEVVWVSRVLWASQ